MTRWRNLGLVPALLAVGSTALGLFGQEGPEPSPEPSVREEMDGLCRSAREGDDPFFGTAIIADLERRLDRPGASFEVQAGVRGRLGRELLRVDRASEAAERFTEGLAIARREGLSEELILQLERDLALTHLLLAEDENCVEDHNHASCLLPIAPAAVHRRKQNTRRAAELYLGYLERRPDDPAVRWLFNLSRMIAGDYPDGVPDALRLPADALAPEAPFPAWREIAAELGVASFNLAGGAVMDDFDGDGLLDLVSSTWDPCGPMKAFRSRGDGTFEDVSRAWGLDEQLGGLNLVHADYDNDGRLDLLVLRGAWRGRHGMIRNSLLRNDLARSGRFVDVTRRAGVAAAYPTQTAAWADYDGDGDLDLYVGHEAGADGLFPSILYRNAGDGTFTDVTDAAGVANLRYAKGVAWGDFDRDGDFDLYVSNIGPNRLYRNRGDGTFADEAEALGVIGPETSFGTWFFDPDGDGDLDLYVADYGTPHSQVAATYLGRTVATGHPVLYRNEGGRFRDRSAESGFRRPLLPMGSNYGDLDSDGDPDIYLGTGVPDLEAIQPNVLYANDGGRFRDVTSAAGFGHLQKGHGIAIGDLDNDGDQDLFEQMGGAYPVDAFFNALYENPLSESASPPAWITLRLEGRKANRFALGAEIEIVVATESGPRSVYQWVGTGGTFGGSSLQQETGLGAATAVESITVRWPGSGTVDRLSGERLVGVAPGGAYRIVEGSGKAEPIELVPFKLGGGERSGPEDGEVKAPASEPTAEHRHPPP